VARLAGEGRSNPKIAQALFVSLKAVETHLSHAHAKLGLSGGDARRHLTAALERAKQYQFRVSALQPRPARASSPEDAVKPVLAGGIGLFDDLLCALW
jgi:hypothetical protein